MKRICILGGTGFVGRSLVNQLAQRNIAARVLTRNRQSAHHLFTIPDIDIFAPRSYSRDDLAAAMRGCDAVVNLVGVLHDRPSGEFERAHVTLATTVFEAAKLAGVKRVVHMSALGAAANPAPSNYLRSRHRGEAAAQAAMSTGLDVTVLRPSIIFGRYNPLLSLFTGMLKAAPVLPLAGADVPFQPIWVEDVARAFVECLVGVNAKQTIGQSYDLGGPQVLTLREVMRTFADAVGAKPLIIGLPAPIAALQATVFGLWPGRKPLMTRDNLASMKAKNTLDHGWPSVFGFQPSAMAPVVMQYLGQDNMQLRLQRFRRG
jgi:uncharacterized protein YbjT (DUF2867 family)